MILDLTQARFEQLESFESEYESKTCAVCGTTKWINHPFCRSCSIKLQRAHMMAFLKRFGGGDWTKMSTPCLRRYSRAYDIARDYLINRNRLPDTGE